jgi:peptidylprolyl isomerase domain and WD repeat-containing protein 1
MAASDNPLFKDQDGPDPTVFCTAWKRNRFFLFTRREPESADDAPGGSGRDIFNEKPSREDQVVAQLSAQSAKQTLGSSAIIRTTMGDIHVRLFPEFAPKAVENFVGLSKKGYYDNLLFHRVIKNFMVQTGDPLGDGTGGDSLWGNDFEDE